MKSKVDRAIHGPGWGEVILGAFLSLLLGIVLGAVLLVLKPVIMAREAPKQPVAGAVYYVQGLPGDATKVKQVLTKRKALVDGQSIRVTEDEVNALISASTVAKAGDKAAEKAQAEQGGMIVTGTPNVRIRDGVFQVGVPVTLSLGLEEKLVAQTRGTFEKRGDVFVYEPTVMYLGSCPLQRLPLVASYLRSKILQSHPIPEDIASAWSRLTTVAVEGNALVLSTQ